MPPPFRLHTYEEPNPLKTRRRITLHSSKQRYFTPFIKTTDWECYPLSRPIDHNPYCPEKFNLHTSHYDRLGIETTEDWITSTKDMSKHLFDEKPKHLRVNPDKSLINIFTSMKPEGPPIECRRKDCIPYEYLTTTQYHYPSTKSKENASKSKPSPHFLTNRRLSYAPGKFLDENYVNHVKQMQCHKMHRHISYNPFTGFYTDGKPGAPPAKGKCVDYQKFMEEYRT